MEDREDEAFRAADQALLAKEVESRILQKIFRRVGIDAEPDARIANELRSLVRIHQNRLHDRTRGGRRFELHGAGVPSQPRGDDPCVRACCWSDSSAGFRLFGGLSGAAVPLRRTAGLRSCPKKGGDPTL